MIISLLVAMDEKRGIGKDGKLPWRLSSDMKRFRELTMGHHLIVGRKTFESIGKPLPAREMIVVTRNHSYKPAGCLTARSVVEAVALAKERGENEAFIGGGAEVYREALPLADRMYVTRVEADTDADTVFPEIDRADWTEAKIARHEADDRNQYSFTFCELERRTR